MRQRGLHLATGVFSATYSGSGTTIGRKSACRAGQNAHNGALDDKQVRSNQIPRTLEDTRWPKTEHKSDAMGMKYVVKWEKRLSGERSRCGWGSSHMSTLPHFRASLDLLSAPLTISLVTNGVSF